MCGIAGFVTGNWSSASADVTWLRDLAASVIAAAPGPDAAPVLTNAVATLNDRFQDLMSLGVHQAIAADAGLKATIAALADAMDAHEAALVAASRAGRTDLDPIIEGLRDHGWQVRQELLGHVARVDALLPGAARGHQLATAFSIEHVIRAIDRLEVRGRDSAGISVQVTLPTFDPTLLPAVLSAEMVDRLNDTHAGHRAMTKAALPDGRVVIGSVYKTANLIGSLGDNGAALRAAIHADDVLWHLAATALSVQVLAHTRWASSGIISVPNCHPHNASLAADSPNASEIGAMFVLNGDVDNHIELQHELVTNRQAAIEPSITTDTKIIPIAHRFANGVDPLDRFRSAIRRLDGSMAIATIDPRRPGEALVAQKGSGQGLHAARLPDGFMFASEVYGLASVTRVAYNLARSVQGGIVARLDATSAEPEVRGVGDGAPVAVSRDTIQIFARDIYRGRFDHFLEKEIHDAPSSVMKTLRGRYRLVEGRVAFDGLPTDIWAKMRQRLKGGLRRVYVIGQGTAGVAGVGIAQLIDRALGRDPRRSIPVVAIRSSELSADIDAYDFEGALVIAVSQSGTTTDTNRAVDLARERGAFVHGIVNRRNSDLVRKSHSVLFTSDGRDVEMSVASTKAFYSQLVAGKLTALFLADALAAMTDIEIAREMFELEALPGKIADVLAMESVIAEAATALAPRARYWAVTGSGINHVAALEIRIKLSELCYKSIPVDYTEDKKHIDLSTEPLTLVIANDLPPGVAGDVVKEVAIFKAHNGRPIVFATDGPDAEALGTYAERVIALPKVGGDLAFVLATVAGHLFGFHAAKAIDVGAQKLKEVMTLIGRVAELGRLEDAPAALEALDRFVEEAAGGAFDSGLGGRDIASLAVIARQMGSAHAAGDTAKVRAVASAALVPVRKAFEETSRPIDTIRHQAKTVTVGTSRPDDALSPAVRDALAKIGISESRLATDDRKALSALSRLVDQVEGMALVHVVPTHDGLTVQRTAEAVGLAALDRYQQPTRPVGLLGAALDDRRLVIGTLGPDAAIIVPVQGDDPGETAALACFSVKMLAYASREQKVAALAALGQYKRRLREWEAQFDTEAEGLLKDEIARTDPAALVFDASALDPSRRTLLAKSA